MDKYFDIAFTPSVAEVQTHKGARDHYADAAATWPAPTRLSEREIAHITATDSLYLASVGETGWPYVQHRGGSPGFLTVVDDHTIGWVERTGNRQYLSAGNVSASDKVAIIIVDYPSRTRLKLYGHAKHDPDPSADMLAKLDGVGLRSDGAMTIDVVSFDWNCPKYITPRFTEQAIRAITEPLQDRIKELEAELAAR